MEISARPWLARTGASLGRRATFDDVPDSDLDRIQALGVHALWVMGTASTGALARRLALGYPELLATYERLIPDWVPADVAGSPFSIAGYEPPASAGGWAALANLRRRLNERGIGLVLDFVPNHLGIDHPWLTSHPERFVRGDARRLAAQPGNWFVHTTPEGEDRVFAHGRDPHFAGWSDTVQIDYRRRDTRRALADLVLDLAARCDGLRCDVAMLVLPDVFARTWGPGPDDEAGDFWREAIAAIRDRHPEFALLAEAYWGTGPRLHEAGFDWIYDKDWYDALASGDVAAVRGRLASGELAFGAHFLENHDETRARTLLGERQRAATALTFSLPGMRFLHEGQMEGAREHVPVQIGRAPLEPTDQDSVRWHELLWRAIAVPDEATWSAPAVRAATEGDVPPIVASAWTSSTECLAVVANLSADESAGRIALPGRARGETIAWSELLTNRNWNAPAADLADTAVRLPGWGVEVLRGKL
ncbi:MAG: hypothetical protein KC591_08780 [Gemmatimonadetes bacterium]|nr:hypothetical protein [Gemmatimonadota bacterium]